MGCFCKAEFFKGKDARYIQFGEDDKNDYYCNTWFKNNAINHLAPLLISVINILAGMIYKYII